VEDEASIAAAASALQDGEPLDLVVVASGLLHAKDVAPEKSYRQLSVASLNRYFAVNATGPALVAKYFLPLLRKTGQLCLPHYLQGSAALATIAWAAGTDTVLRNQR
jgi:NAD(P)-dependent dehydrogenase (short-subunit alcohol dehydrogenase family)